MVIYSFNNQINIEVCEVYFMIICLLIAALIHLLTFLTNKNKETNQNYFFNFFLFHK